MNNGPVLRILVIDDEKVSRTATVQGLRQAGHAVDVATTGRAALARLRDDFYHLVLLELDLEGQVAGDDVLTAIGWRWPKTATIAHTRRATLDDAIDAIAEGVDGYLAKPADPPDVLAAIENALRRRRVRCCAEAEEGLLRWGGLELDQRQRKVRLEDREITLTPSQFAMLRHLMRSAHRVVSPQELFIEMRGEPPDADDNVRRIVRYHVHELRKKLSADRNSPYYVRTVYGEGYTLGAGHFGTADPDDGRDQVTGRRSAE